MELFDSSIKPKSRFWQMPQIFVKLKRWRFHYILLCPSNYRAAVSLSLLHSDKSFGIYLNKLLAVCMGWLGLTVGEIAQSRQEWKNRNHRNGFLIRNESHLVKKGLNFLYSRNCNWFHKRRNQEPSLTFLKKSRLMAVFIVKAIVTDPTVAPSFCPWPPMDSYIS